jgi:hypothetical protein
MFVSSVEAFIQGIAGAIFGGSLGRTKYSSIWIVSFILGFLVSSLSVIYGLVTAPPLSGTAVNWGGLAVIWSGAGCFLSMLFGVGGTFLAFINRRPMQRDLSKIESMQFCAPDKATPLSMPDDTANSPPAVMTFASCQVDGAEKTTHIVEDIRPHVVTVQTPGRH